MQVINYFTRPRSGLISITVGATHGNQCNWLLSPEGLKYLTHSGLNIAQALL